MLHLGDMKTKKQLNFPTVGGNAVITFFFLEISFLKCIHANSLQLDGNIKMTTFQHTFLPLELLSSANLTVAMNKGHHTKLERNAHVHYRMR